MMKLPLTAMAVVLALGGAAFAAENAPAAGTAANQNTVGTAPANETATHPNATNEATGTATINPTGLRPSQRNPLLADNGYVRVGKMIGTNIFNKDDKNIGNVDGVLIGRDGKVLVVVATNNKKVLVPWNQFEFGDAKLNGDNKILMPNETQAGLNKLQNFAYQEQNNNGNKNANNAAVVGTGAGFGTGNAVGTGVNNAAPANNGNGTNQ